MEKINMSRFGNCNEHYRFYTMEHFLLNQKRLGFGAVHLFGGTPHVWIDAYRKDEGADMKSQISDAGLRCASFMIETSSMRYSLDLIREADGKSRAYFDRCYAYAAELGVELVHLQANGYCLDDSIESRKNRMLEDLAREKHRAEEFGLKLSVVNRTGDATNLIRSLTDMQEMVAALGEDAPCCTAETAFFYAFGETLDQWLDGLGEKLVQINLTNTLFDGGRHAWGDGYLNMGDLLDTLEQRNYQGELNCGCMVRSYMQKPWLWDESTAEQISFLRG